MPYTAFSGFDHIASGSLAEVYGACRQDPAALIFDQETGRVVDIDPRFPPGEEGPRPGRPRLGVVAREVTLLPRHWDWLAAQQAAHPWRCASWLKMPAAIRAPGSGHAAMPSIVSPPRWWAMRRVMRKRCARFMPASSEDFAAHIEAWPEDVRRVLEDMTADTF